MGREYTLKWLVSTAAPRVLFGASLAVSSQSHRNKLNSQFLRLTRAALGYKQCRGSRLPPNIAVLEQSRLIPWDLLGARDTTTILSSLQSLGSTLPRKMFQNLGKRSQQSVIEKGKVPGVPLTMNKPLRKQLVQNSFKTVIARRIATERKALASKPMLDSISAFYSKITRGKFPVIASEPVQIRIEQQTLGLVPFPPMIGEGCLEDCPLCGQKVSVQHVAFFCTHLQDLRDLVVSGLDSLVTRNDYPKDSLWVKTSSHLGRLIISYAPHKIYSDIRLNSAFYYKAAVLWDELRDEARIRWDEKLDNPGP